MRYAIISPTGRVTNTIAWDGADAEHVIPPGHVAVESEAAGIGDSYADGVFTPAVAELAVEVAQSALVDAADPLTKQIVGILGAAGVLTPDQMAKILAS